MRFFCLTWPELEKSIIKGQITPQNWKNMGRNWSGTSGTHIPLNFCLRNASPLFSALTQPYWVILELELVVLLTVNKWKVEVCAKICQNCILQQFLFINRWEISNSQEYQNKVGNTRVKLQSQGFFYVGWKMGMSKKCWVLKKLLIKSNVNLRNYRPHDFSSEVLD